MLKSRNYEFVTLNSESVTKFLTISNVDAIVTPIGKHMGYVTSRLLFLLHGKGSDETMGV